jgi:predicted TIM-barrel fold metal-dependent hydrolase
MVTAIDFHVHDATEVAQAYGGHYAEHASSYFRTENRAIPLEETVRVYREQDIMAVLLATDAESNTGLPSVSNDYVAGVVQRYPDVFVGFASVDPWKRKGGVAELERAVTQLGLKGVKFMQIMQGFAPNDRRFYPLYEAARGLGVPVMFHMGMTAMGAGSAGGDGLRLKYGRPIYIDDVAADFPELAIVAAHPAWPWQEEMLAIAMHKANIYIDLSGWAPKYFDPSLIRRINTFLGDRTLFGTDYPFIAPSRWLSEFKTLDIKDELRPKILLENAKRLLKLEAILTEEPAPARGGGEG